MTDQDVTAISSQMMEIDKRLADLQLRKAADLIADLIERFPGLQSKIEAVQHDKWLDEFREENPPMV